MGMLDSVIGGALGAMTQQGAATNGGLMQVVSGLLSGGAAAGGGDGLASLVQQFTHGGLGEVVQSWIGTGANLPISPEQVKSVLGSEQMTAMTQQTGLTHSDLASQLAHLLPQVVDHLTPNGQLPSGGADLGSMVSGLLGGLLRR